MLSKKEKMLLHIYKAAADLDQVEYRRNKLPNDGRINSRQHHLIERELWPQLCQYFPPEKQSVAYFASIVRKATGRTDVGLPGSGPLSRSDAWAVIEALRDRLKYAIRNAKKEAA